MWMFKLNVMNREALGVIGLFTLVLGVLFYVPARIWAKRKLRAEAGFHPIVRLTIAGWVLTGTAAIVLFGGFSLQYIAPESTIGGSVQTSGGRFYLFRNCGSNFLALGDRPQGSRYQSDQRKLVKIVWSHEVV